MIDTERLFDSLNQAMEFTVTEDHIKLLRHLCDGGLYWDPGEGFGGAPYFGSKKPYGNSDVPRDVAEIVEAPDSDWEWHEVEWHMPARAARAPAREAIQEPAGRCRESLPAPARGGRDSAQDRFGHRRVPARPLYAHGTSGAVTGRAISPCPQRAR